MYRILIAEDDESIQKSIKGHLEKWGYLCRAAEDYQNLAAEAAAYQPHLVLLDLMLPSYNGFYWCQEIRKFSKVPIIFISSASEDVNIVTAMSVGGDDFLVKPFSKELLAAKVQAQLRRAYSFSAGSEVFERKGAILDVSASKILYGEKEAELTKNELRILRLLMENGGRVVSRDSLMGSLWQSESFIDENTLSVNVARLRKKLAELGLSDLIETKKNLGYLVK